MGSDEEFVDHRVSQRAGAIRVHAGKLRRSNPNFRIAEQCAKLPVALKPEEIASIPFALKVRFEGQIAKKKKPSKAAALVQALPSPFLD
jgi:hypothetical protein